MFPSANISNLVHPRVPFSSELLVVVYEGDTVWMFLIGTPYRPLSIPLKKTSASWLSIYLSDRVMVMRIALATC